MARLDRLSGAKEVAQVGAAIGREFSHALLAAVMAMPQAALDEAIGELIGAELVFRRGLPPNTTYLFKHALVRDAAYQGMVRRQRALRHGQIAEAIRRLESETVVVRPELLAHHCQEAGQDEQAIGFWAQAGELAVSRSSGAEATAHFDAALVLLAKRPDTLERATLELSLRRRRGQSLILSVGPNSPAFDANAVRALELARHLDRSEEFVDNWVDFASARFSAGRIVEVIERIGELGSQRAAALPLRSRVKIAVVLGTAHTMLGELDDAWRRLSEGMSLDDENPATHARPLVIVDPGVYVRSYAARVRALQGHLEESADLAFQAGQIAATRGHLPTRLMSMGPVINSLILQGRYSDALSQAEEFLASARQFGVQNRIASSTILLGQVRVALGAADEGHLLLRHGYDLWLSAAGRQMCTEFAANAADVLMRSGHADAAARFLHDGLAVQAATEERFYAAELERIQGLLRDRAGDPAAAAEHLRRSLAIADRQGAKLFALRTATDLSQLLRHQGRTEEGLALLQPLYFGFTSGLDWPDLMRAKVELDRCAA
jgi:tetratricopeptide (TPR) repeat protein